MPEQTRPAPIFWFIAKVTGYISAIISMITLFTFCTLGWFFQMPDWLTTVWSIAFPISILVLIICPYFSHRFWNYIHDGHVFSRNTASLLK